VSEVIWRGGSGSRRKRGRVVEERSQIGQIGGAVGGLGGGDFSILENEGSRHLEAVAGEVADAAAFHNRDEPAPPDLRAEEFDEAALAEAESAVELAARIGDAWHVGVLAEVADFLAGFQHVDEDEGRPVALRLLLQFLQAAQDLAGEGAAEMAEENEHERTFRGGLGESLAGGELVDRRGLSD